MGYIQTRLLHQLKTGLVTRYPTLVILRPLAQQSFMELVPLREMQFQFPKTRFSIKLNVSWPVGSTEKCIQTPFL